MASQRRRKQHYLRLAGHVMIDFMSRFVAAPPLSPRGPRDRQQVTVFSWFMDFYTWEKRYHLTRWILSFLFFLLGTRNCLHTRTCYIHTTILAALSQLGEGGLFVFIIPWLRINLVAGEGGQGGMIQKRLLYRTMLGVMGTFQTGSLWNDLIYFSIYLACYCERLGGSHPSSFI